MLGPTTTTPPSLSAIRLLLTSTKSKTSSYNISIPSLLRYSILIPPSSPQKKGQDVNPVPSIPSAEYKKMVPRPPGGFPLRKHSARGCNPSQDVFERKTVRRHSLLVQFLVNGIVRLIFWNDLLHLPHGLHIIIVLGNLNQFLNILVHLIIVILPHLSDTDLFMERRFRALQFVQHLLIEFLSRTKTRILDLNVLGPREFDHTLCQVCNLHRLTHVKHKDLTAVTLRSSL